MQQLNLNVDARTETGKGPNRRLRMSGRIPAVIYGDKKETIKVSIDARDFTNLVRGLDAENTFFNVKGDFLKDQKSDCTCLAREIQYDPVTRAVLHVDFYKIDMTKEAEFEVPIQHTGAPVGVKEGGFLEQNLHHLAIRCLPINVPSFIKVDVSALAIGESIRVSDLKLDESLKVLTDKDQPIYSVAVPAEEPVEETAAEAAEGDAQEPELIGRKKKDEEEDSTEEKN